MHAQRAIVEQFHGAGFIRLPVASIGGAEELSEGGSSGGESGLRMLGGIETTAATRAHARQMLDHAQRD